MANPLTQGLPRTYQAAERWLLENPKFLEQVRNAGASTFNRLGGGFSVAETGSLPTLRTGMAEVAGAGANAAMRAAPYAAGMAIPTPTSLDPAEGIQSKIDAQSAVLGGPKISNDELASIVNQVSGGPTAAPPLELHSAMEPSAGGMPPARGMRKASYSGVPPRGMGAPQASAAISPNDLEAAVQAARQAAPAPHQPSIEEQLQAIGARGLDNGFELDPELLINELTRGGGGANPTIVRRGLPKRVK